MTAWTSEHDAPGFIKPLPLTHTKEKLRKTFLLSPFLTRARSAALSEAVLRPEAFRLAGWAGHRQEVFELGDFSTRWDVRIWVPWDDSSRARSVLTSEFSPSHGRQRGRIVVPGTGMLSWL
jgi:hypothetical protein